MAVGHVGVCTCLAYERGNSFRSRVIQPKELHQCRRDLLAREANNVARSVEMLREHPSDVVVREFLCVDRQRRSISTEFFSQAATVVVVRCG